MHDARNEVKWTRIWPDEAHPQFRIGRIGDDVIAEWIGYATLRADRTGTRTDLQVNGKAANPMAADKFQRGPVQGLLRHLQGGLTMHGAAATLGGTAVLLVGESGVGKSSLVAALCLKHAADFVGDDVTVVEMVGGRPHLVRLEAYHWLDPTSSTAFGLETNEGDGKQPVAPPHSVVSAVPLSAIVNLRFDEHAERPCLRRITGGAVFQTLSRAAMRIVVDDEVIALRDFEQISGLASRVSVFDLSRRHGLEGLDENVETILPLFGEHPLSSARGAP